MSEPNNPLIIPFEQYLKESRTDQRYRDIPVNAKLVNEFFTGEDFDGDGRVYGRDFVIDPDDPKKPPFLIELENANDFVIEKQEQITWQLYWDRIYAPRRPRPIPLHPPLDAIIDSLIREYQTGIDEDKNRLVYGKDFRLLKIDLRDILQLIIAKEKTPYTNMFRWYRNCTYKSFNLEHLRALDILFKLDITDDIPIFTWYYYLSTLGYWNYIPAPDLYATESKPINPIPAVYYLFTRNTTPDKRDVAVRVCPNQITNTIREVRVNIKNNQHLIGEWITKFADPICNILYVGEWGFDFYAKVNHTGGISSFYITCSRIDSDGHEYELFRSISPKISSLSFDKVTWNYKQNTDISISSGDRIIWRIYGITDSPWYRSISLLIDTDHVPTISTTINLDKPVVLSENDILPEIVAPKLFEEFESKIDIDGNGLVYGVDFYIGPSEPNKIVSIQEIEQNVTFIPPKLTMSLIDYQNTFQYDCRKRFISKNL